MTDIFHPAGEGGMNTRSYFQKLIQPFRKTCQGQSSLSYIGPSVWNRLPANIKNTENLNTFKHNVKKYYLAELRKKEI